MCGRFCLTHEPSVVATHFDVAVPEDFPPRYNIAPSQPVLLVIGGSAHRPEAWQPGRQALLARWGFIPSWTRDTAAMPLLFNARSETAAMRNAFRAALTYRRCLLPASGFYEWQRQGAGPAVPYFIRPQSGDPIGFAAILETYLASDGSEVDTVAILTRPAGPALRDIHPREPVVVAPERHEQWLDCHRVTPDRLGAVFASQGVSGWRRDAVSSRVNSVADMSPEIQQPAPIGEPPAQGQLPF